MRTIALAWAGLGLLAGSASAETLDRTVKANSRTAIGVPWASTDSGPQLIRTYHFRIRAE